MSFPMRIEGVGRVVEINAGGAHTCIRDAEGAVACWGRNTNGQLGSGLASRAGSRTEPTPVPRLGPAEELVAGWVHTCARERSDRVLCWGTFFFRDRGEADSTPRVVEGL